MGQTELLAALDAQVEHVVGPMYQGYAELADFKPSPAFDVRILRPEDAEPIRHLARACDAEKPASSLTPIRRDVMDRFAAASTHTEREHSGVDRAESALFASFEDKELAAVAHYSMWASDAASVGVLTHPSHRGRGHGKRVVSAAMTEAFERGHLVLYQTMVSNHASVALASSLGCRDYATTLAVHLSEPA